MKDMEEPVIRCPKCNSSQLTAQKKGFSGKKAVAGVLLTGGIGLLAGTIGSKDIILTCLLCSHQFKPEDAVIIKTQDAVQQEAFSHFESVQRAQRGEKPIEKNDVVDGCFVATACYGDYSAPEVLVFRSFRDNFLKKNEAGKLFIKTYYKFSPALANVISKSQSLKFIVRSTLLKPLLFALKSKYK